MAYDLSNRPFFLDVHFVSPTPVPAVITCPGRGRNWQLIYETDSSPSLDAYADAVLRGVEESDGPDPYTSGRQAARLVDKSLKGTNPTDIPVETNSKIEFIINLKTAKTLGLTIAPEVLFQATKGIR